MYDTISNTKSMKITDEREHIDEFWFTMNEPGCFILEELKGVKIFRQYAME